MFSFLIVLVLVLGLNTILWTTVGGMRVVAARMRRKNAVPERLRAGGPSRDEVAILIAAHNEEVVIGNTIASLAEFGHDINVFVVSDGSTDDTAVIARAHGATVLELSPNRGKAGALVEAIKQFGIAERFEVLLLLDADTHLTADYFETGLGEFADPSVVAVAGRASTLFVPRSPTLMGRLLVAYRERVYIAMQYLFKFGMAARYANVVPIVPGFASMYRTRILADIDIAAQGLKIEDYNMTFEVHAKRLGRIAFHPHAAIALTQDPDTLFDYVKQVQRWNLGFWQTVGRHGFRMRTFWFALTLFIAELVLSSVVLILLIPGVLISTGASTLDELGLDPSGFADDVAGLLPPLALVLGVVIPDYLLSVLAAVVSKRPVYLAYGVVFPFFRIVDALLCMVALFEAVFSRSTGSWKSPSRRPARTETEQPALS
ncbi:glycosyltransferase family 2 protein [Herbiconiux ginsengi]|uniref:Glycosyltransferase, catalytic subunit of cellulose synthase and poly-beta-1,6-N-acetylglucosamine synthase n=1 Tax=Herbiconiux ginsengi TaxID=381665 RepID=A0A1H3RPU4_9MICO|nr:glycosyltransferase [Herbiconiux ginsengi]SDZ27231.1 Glycosyltransferase, catalytic subunit of cellulose synthase and poly-beta-1,6-N-acetylglucosamine synthase [Herbiconiux ginsengi]